MKFEPTETPYIKPRMLIPDERLFWGVIEGERGYDTARNDSVPYISNDICLIRRRNTQLEIIPYQPASHSHYNTTTVKPQIRLWQSIEIPLYLVPLRNKKELSLFCDNAILKLTLKDKRMNILIIGAGTVGTALGRLITQAGHTVDYLDVDQKAPQWEYDIIHYTVPMLTPGS